MKVGIQKDHGDVLDVLGVANALNRVSRSVSFDNLADRPVDQFTARLVNFKDEAARLAKTPVASEYDLLLYVTDRQYPDNFFCDEQDGIAVLSFFGWPHLTPLPRENGVAWFLASLLADAVAEVEQHNISTGCLADMLWIKTDIDRCMKQAFVCTACWSQLEIRADRDGNRSLLTDIRSILDTIANASRWGQSVAALELDAGIAPSDWQAFEQYVADYYRELGAEVRQDVNLAGFQIDAVVTERTRSGEIIRTAVECKFHREKLGNRAVNDFARILATIRDAGLVDRGTLAAYVGFTQDAQLAADHANLKLVTYSDLRHRRGDLPEADHGKAAGLAAVPAPSRTVGGITVEERGPASDVFVIMPFSADFDDTYYFGIHQAIHELGLTCTRVDEVMFTGSILDQIFHQLRSSRVIVAELTKPSPNVYYELGIAHAMQRPVVLLTGDVGQVPFDLKVVNHLVYKNIRDLNIKLRERIKGLLGIE